MEYPQHGEIPKLGVPQGWGIPNTGISQGWGHPEGLKDDGGGGGRIPRMGTLQG